MKTFIKFLYRKFCRKEYLFEKAEPYDYSNLPKEIKQQIRAACRTYLSQGYLKELASTRVSDYESRIIYDERNYPIQVTEAELLRMKIAGLEEFIQDIEMFAMQEDETFDPKQII